MLPRQADQTSSSPAQWQRSPSRLSYKQSPDFKLVRLFASADPSTSSRPSRLRPLVARTAILIVFDPDTPFRSLQQPESSRLSRRSNIPISISPLYVHYCRSEFRARANTQPTAVTGRSVALELPPAPGLPPLNPGVSPPRTKHTADYVLFPARLFATLRCLFRASRVSVVEPFSPICSAQPVQREMHTTH